MFAETAKYSPARQNRGTTPIHNPVQQPNCCGREYFLAACYPSFRRVVYTFDSRVESQLGEVEESTGPALAKVIERCRINYSARTHIGSCPGDLSVR
jgi:hypothetical protein